MALKLLELTRFLSPNLPIYFNLCSFGVRCDRGRFSFHSLFIEVYASKYRHFAFIPNRQLFSRLFSASLALYPSFILCTTSLSQPKFAATCDPRYNQLSVTACHLVSYTFDPHYHTPSTSQLYSCQHSPSTFFFSIFYQTYSPVYSTSSLNQPLVLFHLQITACLYHICTIYTQQCQPYPKHTCIHLSHHTIIVYIKQP